MLHSRFDYSTGKPVGTRSASKSIPADIGTIPIHVRGGFIIPTQVAYSFDVRLVVYTRKIINFGFF